MYYLSYQPVRVAQLKKCIYLCTFLLLVGLVGFGCDKTDSNTPTMLIQSEGYNIQERDNLYGVCYLNREHVWVVGKFGIVLFSADDGKTWKLQDSTTENALYRVEFVDENHGWAAGAFGTMLHTVDGGKSWVAQAVNTEEHILDMEFVDTQNGWAVGPWGTVCTTRNGGETWKLQPLGEDITLNSVCFIDDQTGWIGGEWGTVLRTTDGGNQWMKQESSLETSLFGIYFSDSQHGYAVGMLGKMIATENGGETWKQIDTRVTTTLLGTVAGHDRIWSVGSKGSLIVTSINEAGAKSSFIAVPTNQWLSSVSLLPADQNYAFIVGGRGTILFTEDGGNKWVHRGHSLD